MIMQIASGIGIFVLSIVGVLYFVALTIVVWQVWVGIIQDIKRFRAKRKGET